MPSGIFTNGLHQVINRTIDFVGSASVKVMLVDSTYSFNKDETAMSTASVGPTAKETTATGYTGGFNGAGRQALSGKSITYDAATDRIRFFASNVTWTGLGGGVTLGGAVVFFQGASDAASVPIFFVDPTDLVTNGSDVQLQFDATNGIAYIQN